MSELEQEERWARGMYFEDFEVGMTLVTPSRTITRTDIVNFCCLTGDFNEVHANIEYAKTTLFGDVIAHGPLVYGICEGLQYASGINDGTLLALLGIENWKLIKPVMTGDTIHMMQVVFETRRTSSGDKGIVRVQRQVINQRKERVQEMDTAMLYKCRPC